MVDVAMSYNLDFTVGLDTTGFYFDDTKRYVDALPALSDDDRYMIFEGNARRVYPRLDKLLTSRGRPGRQA